MVLKTELRSQASNTAPSDSQSEAQALSESERFDLPQTRRRRETIRYLLRTDRPVRMPELVQYVAANECETTTTEVSRDQHQRRLHPTVSITSHQTRRERCYRAREISWNRPANRLEIFRPYLESIAEDSGGTQPTPGSAESVNAAAAAGISQRPG